ncbi:hypothetical protein LY78DRAFT_712692 [Colletotrichum sublineola]|nr:hypothetical protein LY78DRAFT_712692 [Colletotrichum sublineola]
MIHRNRALVRYIWFSLELNEYKCATEGRYDEFEEMFQISDIDKYPVTTAFQNLFLVPSTWDLQGDLILHISIYSPSDSEYGFHLRRYQTDYHAPQHGWVAGFRHSAPPKKAVMKVFHPIMEQGSFDSDQLELQW